MSFSREIFAENLRMARGKMSLTQTKAADMIGVSNPTLSCYEKGTKIPKIDTMISISKVYGQKIEWFFKKH